MSEEKLPRLCNWCLGASRTSGYHLRHPTLPPDEGLDQMSNQIEAFRHSGRSCPHMKLHLEIWKEKSHQVYRELTSLISSAGLGVGALIEIQSNYSAPIKIRHGVITAVDFESDVLYGINPDKNRMFKVAWDGDVPAIFSRGTSLNLYDLIVNQPGMEAPGRPYHDREWAKAFLKEHMPSINENNRISFPCWETSAWAYEYVSNRKSLYSINVVSPAPVMVPEPKEDIKYSQLLKTIRSEGAKISKTVRYFWY